MNQAFRSLQDLSLLLAMRWSQASFRPRRGSTSALASMLAGRLRRRVHYKQTLLCVLSDWVLALL